VKQIRFALSSLFLVLLVFLTACGGGGGSSTPYVTISGAPSTLAPGATATLGASVTNDSSNSGVTWSLAGSGSLSNNTPTSVTYTAPSSVPAPPSVTITATSVADTTASNSVSFIIAQPAVQVPQYLNGQYAFVASGFDPSGNPLTVGGSITADGNGNITDGVIDENDNLNNTTTGTKVTGTYTLDSNLRGSIKISNALQAFSNNPTFSFTIDSTTNSGTIVSLDPSLPAVSGTIDKQQATVFDAMPSGPFILRAYSDNPQRSSMVGRLSVVGGGSISNGLYDLADILNGNDSSDATVTGSFTISDAHGRGTIQLNLAGQTNSLYAYYAVSASKIYIFENGNTTSGSTTQMVGQLRTQSLSSLNASSPNGSAIFGLIGGNYFPDPDNGITYLLSSVAVGNLSITGGTNASANYDLNDAGIVNTSTGFSPVTGPVAFDPTTGRGTIAFNSGFDNGFIDSAAFFLEANGKGVFLDTTGFNGDAYPEALVGDLTPQTPTSAISGTVQGVDLISESDLSAVATAATVSSGRIVGLQDGSTANLAAGTSSDEALTGTLGSVSSTGRSVATLNSFFLSNDFPAIAFAIDPTHFYLIGVDGASAEVPGGYTSSLAIYSTQTLPTVPTRQTASQKLGSAGRTMAARKSLPKGLTPKHHGTLHLEASSQK
jgi:hypothetical protein